MHFKFVNQVHLCTVCLSLNLRITIDIMILEYFKFDLNCQWCLHFHYKYAMAYSTSTLIIAIYIRWHHRMVFYLKQLEEAKIWRHFLIEYGMDLRTKL